MHPKTFTLRAPLDRQTLQLEQYLTALSRVGARIYLGSYSGRGMEQTLTLPFAPIVLCFMAKPDPPDSSAGAAGFPQAGRILLWTKLNPLVAWDSAGNYVSDAVIGLKENVVTLGTNIACNADGSPYQYILVG